jgi:hypothetical protein
MQFAEDEDNERSSSVVSGPSTSDREEKLYKKAPRRFPEGRRDPGAGLRAPEGS